MNEYREAIKIIKETAINPNQSDTVKQSIMEVIARILKACILVIDYTQNEVVYSADFLLADNKENPTEIQFNTLLPYKSLISKDDVGTLTDAEVLYKQIISNHSLEDKLQHLYTADYGISLNNQDMTLTQRFSPISYTDKGKLHLAVFFITQSIHKSCIQKDLLNNPFYYSYNFDLKEFLPFKKNMVLTQTDKQILLKTSEGMTNKQIADELNLSVNTIKTHKSRIFAKLNVRSIAEALTKANKEELY